jgi:hypothetical protein
LFRHRDQDPEIENNALVRLTRRVLPVATYDDGRMLTRVEGRRAATPLFVVLVTIGSSDILFALDSIPAVFGVTEEASSSSQPTRSRCSGSALCISFVRAIDGEIAADGLTTSACTSRPGGATPAEMTRRAGCFRPPIGRSGPRIRCGRRGAWQPLAGCAARPGEGVPNGARGDTPVTSRRARRG